MPFTKRKSNRVVRSRYTKLIKLIRSCGVLVLSFTLVLYGRYKLSPMQVWELEITPIKFLVHSPAFLAVNEEEVIRVAAQNQGDTKVQSRYRLNGNSFPVFIGGQGGTNVFFDGVSQKGEQIERQVRIFVPFDSTMFDPTAADGFPAGLVMTVSLNNRDSGFQELPLRVAPVPMHNTIFNWSAIFFGVFILGSIKDRLGISVQELLDLLLKLLGIS